MRSESESLVMSGFLDPPSMTLMATWFLGARWWFGKSEEVKRAPRISVFSGRLASMPNPSSGCLTVERLYPRRMLVTGGW